ncbi:cytidine deaminase [Hasllibacter halocynthiae]|uniref:Cytidine deaminase n=1 Tax=Hasllibacter halocynthiae TaxID=595589 RepID=A0A2T0X3V0_9RHOB|nr:cytidine deaminase [Hasllibacter halocynthiae]PRY93618.1 cytidine deaminase [Hasllibacter halocynthiae]
MSLPPRAEAALAAARALIAERYEEGRHHVASAAATAAGVHLGVNLECTLPRATICAEPGALAAARVADPASPIEVVVAVNRRGEVIPPCGVCRELLVDYAPGCHVIVPGERLVPLRALLPEAWKEAERWGR